MAWMWVTCTVFDISVLVLCLGASISVNTYLISNCFIISPALSVYFPFFPGHITIGTDIPNWFLFPSFSLSLCSSLLLVTYKKVLQYLTVASAWSRTMPESITILSYGVCFYHARRHYNTHFNTSDRKKGGSDYREWWKTTVWYTE